MLQLMGWLGFLMLAVKLVEMAFSKNFRNEKGKMDDRLMTLIVLAALAMVALAYLFAEQAKIYEEVLGVAQQYGSGF